MARKLLDATGNEPMGVAYAKINDNFAELYSADSGLTNWNGDTVTATGLISGGALQVDTGTKTASATAGAATLNKDSGKITTESLTTAAGATYTLTLTSGSITANDLVFASVAFGSASAGMPIVTSVAPASNSVVITILNGHASAAFNGTLKISYLVVKA